MERVLGCFKKNSFTITNIRRDENFESYTLSFELTNILGDLKWDDISFFSQLVSKRDTASVNITVNEGDPYTFKLNGDKENYEQLLGNINKIKEQEHDTSIRLEYQIYKTTVNFTTSIYDLDVFSKYLKEQKLIYLLNHLHKVTNLKHLNIYEVQNDESEQIYFQSPVIIFVSDKKPINTYNVTDHNKRQIILERRKLNTNPQNFSKYNFIPEDFNDYSERIQSDLVNLFNKLKVVTAASFISNLSNIENNDTIRLGIIGHKYIEITTEFKTLEYNLAQSFYLVYQWVFFSGDTNDKLDLARNIITRYFKSSPNKWILPADTLSSIQSAHAIYLKENVEKYIETKNKVAEITTELSVKSKDVSEYFISTFKNNNLTLLTYFISIFIFNSLSNNSDKKIFTEEKYYLSLVFLLISTIYLLITRKQLYKELKVTIRYFYSIKRIYRDIFDKQELNNLFHKRHLQYNVQNVKQSVNLYSWLWLIEIISLLIISLYFTFLL